MHKQPQTTHIIGRASSHHMVAHGEGNHGRYVTQNSWALQDFAPATTLSWCFATHTTSCVFSEVCPCRACGAMGGG
jgi:hypothetical protein